MMPLYEAKMIHHYDTRWATYEPDGSTRHLSESEKADGIAPMPRYWVSEKDIATKLGDSWNNNWFLGWRRIARSTDERTLIVAMAPRVGFGDSVFLMLPTAAPARRASLQAALTSYALDFAARQKIGGTNASFFLVEQLPVPGPATRLAQIDHEWVGSRVDRLNGWVVDTDERARLRAELDAYFFHVYGLDRDDVDYVMETFPIVRRKDEASYGSYRTKELILAAYDDLAVAAR